MNELVFELHFKNVNETDHSLVFLGRCLNLVLPWKCGSKRCVFLRSVMSTMALEGVSITYVFAFTIIITGVRAKP